MVSFIGTVAKKKSRFVIAVHLRGWKDDDCIMTLQVYAVESRERLAESASGEVANILETNDFIEVEASWIL